jgi:hypothetical protein
MTTTWQAPTKKAAAKPLQTTAAVKPDVSDAKPRQSANRQAAFYGDKPATGGG